MMKKLFTLSLLCMSVISTPSSAYNEPKPASEAMIPTNLWGEWVGFTEGKSMTSKELKKVCSGDYDDNWSVVTLEIAPDDIQEVYELNSVFMTPTYYYKLEPTFIHGRVKIETPLLGESEENINVSYEDFAYGLENGELYEYEIDKKGRKYQSRVFYRCP